MSERFKEHAWKACVGETQPWVRIPPSPPSSLSSSGVSQHKLACRVLAHSLGRAQDRPHLPDTAMQQTTNVFLSEQISIGASSRMSVRGPKRKREEPYILWRMTAWPRLFAGRPPGSQEVNDEQAETTCNPVPREGNQDVPSSCFVLVEEGHQGTCASGS